MQQLQMIEMWSMKHSCKWKKTFQFQTSETFSLYKTVFGTYFVKRNQFSPFLVAFCTTKTNCPSKKMHFFKRKLFWDLKLRYIFFRRCMNGSESKYFLYFLSDAHAIFCWWQQIQPSEPSEIHFLCVSQSNFKRQAGVKTKMIFHQHFKLSDF